MLVKHSLSSNFPGKLHDVTKSAVMFLQTICLLSKPSFAIWYNIDIARVDFSETNSSFPDKKMFIRNYILNYSKSDFKNFYSTFVRKKQLFATK